MWVLLFHLLLFFKCLKGEGGHEFIYIYNFTLKRGGAPGFIYLLFFLIIYYLYSFVTFLTSLRGEGGMGFVFFLFCIFCIVC